MVVGRKPVRPHGCEVKGTRQRQGVRSKRDKAREEDKLDKHYLTAQTPHQA
jgi:hypothetical protein